MVMLITKCFPQETKKIETCRAVDMKEKRKTGKAEKETREEREREESPIYFSVFSQIILIPQFLIYFFKN